MKKNFILLIILALLAAVFFWDKEREAKKQEREEKEKELLTLKKDEIQEIEIVKGEDTFKAVKQGDRWNLVKPLESSADKNAWDTIANNYSSGKWQRVIEENPASLTPFGLDKPAVQVSLAGVGGATKSEILLGAKTPTAGKYYAMVKGSSEVVTVMSSLYSAVDKQLYDLRDKTILDMQTEDVQRIQIAQGDMNVSLDKRGMDQWVITQPTQARANETKIRDMLNRIRGGEIKKFVDENSETPAVYGLVNPATKLVFWTGQPGNESSWASRVLLLGATSAADQLYAMREGQKNVFTVNPQDFNNVPASLEDLRQKKVCPMKYWEVDRLNVISAGQTILEASKSAGNWTMLQPKQGTANYNSVSDAARAIADLEAAGFVLGTTEEYGLASPNLVIQLEKHGDSLAAGSTQSPTGVVRETLALAFPPNQTAGEEFYYGARMDPLEIYRIKKSTVDDLMSKVSAVTMEAEVKPATAPEAPSASEPGLKPATPEAKAPAAPEAVVPLAAEPPAAATSVSPSPAISEPTTPAETEAKTPAPATSPESVSPAPGNRPEAAPPAVEAQPQPAAPPSAATPETVAPSTPETPGAPADSAPSTGETVPAAESGSANP
ncbi:MAG: DUF4340 domain-containing protein [bacterium]